MCVGGGGRGEVKERERWKDGKSLQLRVTHILNRAQHLTKGKRADILMKVMAG